ncbi:MAG: DUF362 domain-containing protein [Calditrichaeota bacterium]|nr:MAG: DUF362 domain-containing protein [Calditrichota bacterium]
MTGMNRRTFMKSIAAASLISTMGRNAKSGTRMNTGFFGVHPFIEENPDAVFIMRTSVGDKYNYAAKKDAGYLFAQSVFIAKGAGDLHAFPVSRLIAMKPNLTSYTQNKPVDIKMGIVTDPDFMEGLIEGMKTLGLSGSQFYMREVNGEELVDDNGYAAMADRTGADLLVKGTVAAQIKPSLVVWKDNPDGTYFTKIPYLWPINAPDTFLINIAKFKAHGMGLTLTAKNLQGTIVRNYQAHCTSYTDHLDMDSNHRNPKAKDVIKQNYLRHKAAGIPRWDKPGTDFNCGHGMEAWASRCLDNNTVTKPELHIIEGIYGHDGNFTSGPHDGKPKDFMANIIVFGKNPFHVDSIGHWLGGHEPGNFGLLHMALEKGMSTLLNPADIPVYAWNTDGSAILTPFNQFPQTPLLTYYLQRNYDGQNEPYWHLCDEPYQYAPAAVKHDRSTPSTFELAQNYPNPFNANTTIRFTLPRAGDVRLEIFNAYGQRVDVATEGRFGAGSHHVLWRANGFPTGTYIYRCFCNGYVETGKMVLVK